MRPAFLALGVVLCTLGVEVIFYQLSESCESNSVASSNLLYPWCTDVLDHINFTFVGIVALFAGVVVLALGSSLHWLVEPPEPEVEGSN